MGSSKPLLPCTEETRELVRACKRGGESYDELLRKMVDQYNPENPTRTRETGDNR